MSDKIAPISKAVLEREGNASIAINSFSEKMPLEFLEVQALRDRIYAETGQRSFKDDPMFASRAHLEALDAVLKNHELAVSQSMEQRVEVYTNLMNEGLHKLREEALVENLREKLVMMQNLTAENTKICEKMEEQAKLNKRSVKQSYYIAGFTFLSLLTSVLIFTLLIK